MSSLSPSRSTGSSILTSNRTEASVTNQTACVFLVRLSVSGLPGFLFIVRLVFSLACENPSESTTVRRTNYRSSHKRNGVSIFALDLRFFIQYKLVTPLKWTVGGYQRFAHICDLPRGVHIASSACLDSKASLSWVLDVRPACSFETNSALRLGGRLQWKFSTH